jgi:hypothetical protein
LYQQPTASSNSSNSFIDHHQNNISSHQQQQVQSMLYKESNLKRSHNNKSNCIKKHVKFAKSSKLTTPMAISGRSIQSAPSSKHAMKSSSKKIKKFSTKDHKMMSSTVSSMPIESMEAAAMQQPLYYYYYYPEETTLPSTTAISDEQQYFYPNNNYYYYAIDGTSVDVNYPPEFFIQPTVGNENYMR